VTFPNGGKGVIDGHHSGRGRSELTEIIGDERIHFVCLTHPHADHGKGLIPLLESKDHNVDEFWHTLSDVNVFVFTAGGQIASYRSPIKETVREFHRGWGQFLTEIYGNVGIKKIPPHKLRADLERKEIDEVHIHVLAPEETEQIKFTEAYNEIASSVRKARPDPNALSAVLAFEYKGVVALLGADALKRNWKAVLKRYNTIGLPRAKIIKIPHHGAKNGLELGQGKKSYLDLCERGGFGVLFAGDTKHPHPTVEMKLGERINLSCLSNGLHGKRERDPLGLGMIGGSAITGVEPCQEHIRFEIFEDGRVDMTKGFSCDACPRRATSANLVGIG